MPKLNKQQAKTVADALLSPQQASIDAKKQRQEKAQQKAIAQRKRMAWALPCVAGGFALGLFNTAPTVSALLAILTVAALLKLWLRPTIKEE
ncbi:hypothetical protein [Alkalimonas amylolytica]|uniref:Uncharacterized protein n=1 Tax=Alkalimonas amylolytica TaxID=152573 RepID=A0A1H4FUH0_ALKAM|nr:hypothetical protein [Alkalimonas amylolytica]SEB00999.1 hypothetical protein SAMN04488051_11353 [Alkalimonas amylolytica]